MKCYEGSEPYIFLSYAHKNADMVMPVFRGLYKEGFRIWYDAGTEPGTEWPEYIAEHLAGASCCICFLTDEFLNSDNCRQELNFALSKKIPVLVIYMEDVKLTAGMEMRLGLTQAMFRERFHGVDDFLRALYDAKILRSCNQDNLSVPNVTNSLVPISSDRQNSVEASFSMEEETIQTEVVDVTNESKPHYQLKKARYSEGFDFKKLDDSTCAIKNIGKCQDKNIKIPPIAPNGDLITAIGSKAFALCKYLISVTIPVSVKTIGDRAFSGCKALKKVDLPNSLLSIGDQAFRDCRVLEAINIPDGVKSIGNHAFSDCRRMFSVTISSSVTTIGDNAFKNCNGLSTVTLPQSIISIGKSIFGSCNNLKTIHVDSNNPLYYSFDNCVIDRQTKELVIGIKTSKIPNNVSSIGNYAFKDCCDLSDIVIPNTVTVIGECAFSGCSALASMNLTQNVSIIAKSAFRDCTGLETITIMNGTVLIGDYAFCGCSKLTVVIVPNSMKTIGSNAFNGCRNMLSVYIPISVETIGSWVFYCCPNATIYCEHPSQPDTWAKDWNPDNLPVVWGYKPENK